MVRFLLILSVLFIYSEAHSGTHKFSAAKVPIEHAEILSNEAGAVLYIEGYLPDSCHGEPYARVLEKYQAFEVELLSKVDGDFCLERVRDFDLHIDLSRLVSPGAGEPAGKRDYRAYLQSGTAWGSTLSFEIFD